ncbi:DDE Tnp IS1595 domain-containing protein [Aphis craccivora]|uniref:DDE Tnp IS1595 domain-containing protein n=1 Tax=Aphis craccivora TaxID=307492 RepID=A0A6G0ZHB4_APHCR|nr:DDE Tnp IS1595 domain-containing protein [Aphis craccivora]
MGHEYRRDSATLLPIIQREEEVGSTIHSDEWRAYSNLSDQFFENMKKSSLIYPDDTYNP